ncbi:MAG: c-type cytochrome domain-containing protein, partial [Pirellulales bacterium]
MRIISMLLIMVLTSVAYAAEPISFNKQIRPILADRCFACHGPDSAQRVSDMRLDQEETTFKE